MVWEMNHVTSRNRNPFKILGNTKQKAQKVKKGQLSMLHCLTPGY